MHRRLYLAGPEVFYTNMPEIREAKIKICMEYNFIGIFPIDGEKLPDLPDNELGYYMCRKNKNKIRSSDGIIANVSPFRGPSADVGTMYEIGFADGLDKPVFAYTNSHQNFKDRTLEFCGGWESNKAAYDSDGIIIENFNLVDNLMLDGSITSLSINKKTVELEDLYMFEQAVIEAKKFFTNLDT